MFYRTQIQSVTEYGATDKEGRALRFMGNFPVKAGDWVFTDGELVFGHVPQRGSTPIVDEPSGIPVLADKSYFSENEESLRGYFNRNGRFKKFSVAQDAWITNSDKKFAHGAEYLNDVEKVIDAYIGKDGKPLVATNGFWCDNHILNFSFVKIYINEDLTLYPEKPYGVSTYYPCVYEQTLGSDVFPYEQSNILIYTDEKQIDELDLTPYAKDTEQRALECAYQIMENDFQAENFSITFTHHHYLSGGEVFEQQITMWYRCSPIEEITKYCRENSTGVVGAMLKPMDYPAQKPPEEPFIVHTTAHVLTCNINDNGLEGVVFASTYGYCFPHIQPRFAADFVEYLEYEHEYNLLEEFKCVPFGFSAFYQIGSDIPVAYRVFGGISADLPFIDYSDAVLERIFEAGAGMFVPFKKLMQTRHIELLPQEMSYDLSEEILFPVGAGFFSMDKFGRLSFFNSKRDKIAENISVHKDFLHIEIEYGQFHTDFYNLSFNDKPFLRCKVYTPDGKVEDKVMIITGNDNNIYQDAEGNVLEKIYSGETKRGVLPPKDGYYIKINNANFEPLQFTPLFYQFNENCYIYGVKDGLLYQNIDGKESVIADGVKNFRLNELRNISKARR